MTAAWVADRSRLRHLWKTHPDWYLREYAQTLGRSLSWVKRWVRRFQEDPDNPEVIWDRPRIQPPREGFAEDVVQQVLRIRDDPPEDLHRIPGPRTILYFLPRVGLPAELRLPKSTRTIWKILRAHDRIHAARRRYHQPLDRPDPLAEVQLDFKDVSSARGDPDAKQIHQVEVFDAIDVGTSVWLMAEPSTEYRADTVFAPLLRLLERMGLPESVRFDRDPRFMGSPGMRDFPTPFVRFWYALGITPVINPPHRPDLNAYVERLHRTVEQEYVLWEWPDSYATTLETLPRFQQHYNTVRPHQGLSCGNRPPLVAHPTFPTRPSLPDEVDPDAWLTTYEGVGFPRKVKPNGSIVLDDKSYYVGKARAGQEVLVRIQSASRSILVWQQHTLVRALPLKGLVGHRMRLDAFVAWCEQEARAMWRVYLRQRTFAHAG